MSPAFKNRSYASASLTNAFSAPFTFLDIEACSRAFRGRRWSRICVSGTWVCFSQRERKGISGEKSQRTSSSSVGNPVDLLSPRRAPLPIVPYNPRAPIACKSILRSTRCARLSSTGHANNDSSLAMARYERTSNRRCALRVRRFPHPAGATAGAARIKFPSNPLWDQIHCSKPSTSRQTPTRTASTLRRSGRGKIGTFLPRLARMHGAALVHVHT